MEDVCVDLVSYKFDNTFKNILLFLKYPSQVSLSDVTGSRGEHGHNPDVKR